MTNSRTSYQTGFIRFHWEGILNKQTHNFLKQSNMFLCTSVSVNHRWWFICACLCVCVWVNIKFTLEPPNGSTVGCKMHVRSVCAPLGRCRLSQQSNNSSACRYAVMSVPGASAWECPAQLLSITTNAPKDFWHICKTLGGFSFCLRTEDRCLTFLLSPSRAMKTEPCYREALRYLNARQSQKFGHIWRVKCSLQG